MIYGFIAYMPDGVDTCRGCVMDSWSSDLICFSSDNREHFLKKLVDVYLRDHALKNGSYDIEIQINGLAVLSEGYSNFYVRDENCNIEYFEEIAYELRSEAKKEAERIIAREKEEKKITEEKAQLAKAKAEADRKERSDRELYETLRKKFEG